MMRRAGLSTVMVAIGIALCGGTAVHDLPAGLVPAGLRPLDQYVGTNGSVVGAVFGLGVIYSAWRPRENLFVIHLVIAYALLLILDNLAGQFLLGRTLTLAAVVFGLASGALLLALYPSRPAPSRPASTPSTPDPASPVVAAKTPATEVPPAEMATVNSEPHAAGPRGQGRRKLPRGPRPASGPAPRP